MKLTLDQTQAAHAVRDYLADPGEGDVFAIKLPESEPIRIATARGGGLVIYTGKDAEARKRKPKEKSVTK